MRVALDAQLTVGTATGIGEYVRGLAPALAALGTDVCVLRAPRLDPWRFDRRVLWDQFLFPLRAARARPDVVHCAAGTLPLAPVRVPLVATVHDVAWLRVQQHAPRYARAYFGALTARRYRAARAILTDSAFTRDELLASIPLDPARVFAVHLGVGAEFGRLARRPADGPATILAVGTVEPRKALATVIEALPAVPAARLVSVGPPTPYVEECRARAAALGVADRVEFAGYVSRDELLRRYAEAAVAVAPSRYEGFGYAAAQALCAGVPLLCSDAASHPEIADGDATVVPAGESAAWGEALRAVLAAPEQAEARAAAVRPRAVARFSWDACARGTLAAYEAARR